MVVDRLLGRLQVEEARELGDRAPVREPGGDVRPLARVVALRVEAAELVQRRAGAQDRVRVVVDEANPVQYFEK